MNLVRKYPIRSSETSNWELELEYIEQNSQQGH